MAAALFATACANGGRDAARSSEGLVVVATTTQVADFSREVAGDLLGQRVEVRSLAKPNVDAHDVEPSPADLTTVAAADVIVENGAGLEEYLRPLLAASGTRARTVDASDGVMLRRDDGGTGTADPHIWHDPRNARIMVANIAEGLAAADPDRADAYRANATAYQAKLDQLDADIAARIATLTNRKLVTNHDAFRYYVDRYGLTFVGSIIPGFDSSAELSAADLTDLVARIRAEGVTAVFTEGSLPPTTAEAIARDAGVTVVSGEAALYGDSLGPPGSGADTYLAMMRHNTDTIVENLR